MDTGRFHALSIVENAAANVGMQISLRDTDLISSWIYPEVGLLDHAIFNFLRHLHTISHNDCAKLLSD